MKRVTAMVLTVVLLLMAMPFASAQEAVSITVGSIQGEVGDIVQVPVSVSDGHYLVNGRIFLQYDPTVLELQKVCEDEDNPYVESVNPAIFDSTCMWGFASPEAGRANFVFASAADSGSATGGVMYTLTFKLLGTALDDAITVTIPEMRSNNGGEDFDTAPSVEEATVNITHKGDVDLDGAVNLQDAVYLFLYYNGAGADTLSDKQMGNADLDGDGVITLLDVSRLFYHVNGAFEL